ncbi:hypothetical protein V6N13_144893 [Hibiscus sabdariffa]|uniref:Secreted protein n=1 Tax=Hibiscus sabdariffa TaxID=183260 RepID=A0ABR2FM15_9ROSI
MWLCPLILISIRHSVSQSHHNPRPCNVDTENYTLKNRKLEIDIGSCRVIAAPVHVDASCSTPLLPKIESHGIISFVWFASLEKSTILQFLSSLPTEHWKEEKQ